VKSQGAGCGVLLLLFLLVAVISQPGVIEVLAMIAAAVGVIAVILAVTGDLMKLKPSSSTTTPTHHSDRPPRGASGTARSSSHAYGPSRVTDDSTTAPHAYFDYYRYKAQKARPTSGSQGYAYPFRAPHYPAGDGPAFEKHVKELLNNRGYRVSETPGSGDYGVDLIATHHGHKVAIQAKNHAKPVGVRAVQEAHAGLRYYGADEAWVVSRSGFTQQAQTLAKATGVRLVDVKHLEVH